jgi:hypothetical protein
MIATCAAKADTRKTPMLDNINMSGLIFTLSAPDTHQFLWIDYNDYLRQLEAAWLRLSDADIPLNPRIVGGPGVGKTTLACAAARATGHEVYISFSSWRFLRADLHDEPASQVLVVDFPRRADEP